VTHSLNLTRQRERDLTPPFKIAPAHARDRRATEAADDDGGQADDRHRPTGMPTSRLKSASVVLNERVGGVADGSTVAQTA
jgi:hypothetical protein